jgi:menaquinone-specific isochorismate synthase
MTFSTELSRALSLPEAVTTLADQVRQFFATLPAPGGSHPVRMSVPVGEVEPLRWLRGQTDDRRSYWSSRDGSFEIAGCGIADELIATPPFEFSNLLRDHPCDPVAATNSLRYVGGIPFDIDHKRTSPSADPFGVARLTLPLIELRREDDQRTLSCHVVPGMTSPDRILAALDSLNNSEAPEARLSGCMRSRQFLPDQAAWETIVRSTIELIKAETMTKVVLSRRCVLEAEEQLDPFDLLAVLRLASTECYHFAVQVGDRSFVAHSPERLYRRDGRQILSEALAGTRPRSRDLIQDARFSEELLHSHKDREEHRLVVEEIRRALRLLCARTDDDQAPQVSLRKLTLVQHLSTCFRGELAPSVDDASILSALHPTPAVAGTPTAEALKHIGEVEDYDRGWYAGPIGWVSPDAAEFAVGIRSCSIERNRLTAFAGAGIVAGSVPEDEWRETAAKLASFLRLFDKS